jgi:hypothetical protein
MPGLAMIVFVISEKKKSFSKASMLIYISAAVVAVYILMSFDFPFVRLLGVR